MIFISMVDFGGTIRHKNETGDCPGNELLAAFCAVPAIG
jgi:hypothetical protein